MAIIWYFHGDRYRVDMHGHGGHYGKVYGYGETETKDKMKAGK